MRRKESSAASEWDKRQGWSFEVPYVEAGKSVIKGEDGTMFSTKNWWEYIDPDFKSKALGKYTGHYTAFGLPFEGQTTQLNCAVEEQSSKYDKIHYLHLDWDTKTASYTGMKRKEDGNEIPFKRRSE